PARNARVALRSQDQPRARPVHSNHVRNTRASGARFGRVRIATPAMTPPAARLGMVPRRTQAVATAQPAAAGTSLIALNTMPWNPGLVTSSHAPSAPIQSDPSRRPMTNVAATRIAPPNGAIQNGAESPPTTLARAITSGRPGGYIGTIAAP